MTSELSRNDRRNFLLNLTEGALWISGASFIASQTVLPALIIRLGGGNMAVGVFNVILWVFLFLPQIFAARYIQTLVWKKPWAIRFGAVHRVIVLVIGLIVALLGGSHPMLTLLLFFVLFAMNQAFMGVTSPGWFDMYAKMTPLGLRGRLSGIRTAIAGAGSFASGFFLIWLLGAYVFPLNYGLAILIASLFQFASLITQMKLVEDHPSKVMPQLPAREYFLQLRSIFLENSEFRQFIIACVILTLATIPVGFMTVYAIKTFHADEQLVGEFTILMILGQIVGGIGNGLIADHRGNKLALVSASCALLAASTLALFAPSLTWFAVVFFLLGANLGSELMTRYNLAIEYGPAEQRSTYIGLMNTILAPGYLVGLLGGWISNAYGYKAVFALGIACSLAGILYLIFNVDEPRRGRVEQGAESRERKAWSGEDGAVSREW